MRVSLLLFVIVILTVTMRMCRLLAYLGPDIYPDKLIIEAEHNMIKQAWNPRELREAVLNADGFGLGWYNQSQPARYRQHIPIWNDANLPDICTSIQRPLWLAMVRSATPGLGTHHFNTQPFAYQHWLYLHNGYIENFPNKIRAAFRHSLDDEHQDLIQGDTDSEYIFALLFQHLSQNDNPVAAIRACLGHIEELIGDRRALLNLVISDGRQIYAVKHAIHGLCPSFYIARRHPDFNNGTLLASEALDQHACWEPLPDHSLLRLMPDSEAMIENL